MSYNNYNSNAKSNYSSFQRNITSFTSLGDKDKLYSNLQNAEGLVKSLVDDRDVEENDMDHVILKDSISNMTNIYIKPKISLEDISDFYTTYGNVEDMHKKIRGGTS